MKRFLSIFLAAGVIGACAGEEFSAREEALAPAGSNAAFVSNTLPATMAPGERRVVSVTVTNTGATAGTNDWTPSSPTYALGRVGGDYFGWVSAAVASVIPTGSTTTLTFQVTAPSAPGSYTFGAQMYVAGGGGGVFGPLLTVPITVDAGATPNFGCTYEPALSDVPTTMTPNSNRTVTVAVRNTGSATWTPGSFRLYSRNSPLAFWGVGNVVLGSTTAPGAVASFVFSIRSPSTSGPHPFRWDMFQDGPGIGFFGQNCVDLSIAVSGTAALASSVGSSSFPSAMAPSGLYNVAIEMVNTGSQTWTSGTSFGLYATHPTGVGTFGSAVVYLNANVSPGSSHTFNFAVRAPSAPGMYLASYRMRKFTGGDAGIFGATFSTSVTVSGATANEFGCAYVSSSSDVPATMFTNTNRNVTVAVQNTGTATWTPSSFRLYSRNTPTTLWSSATSVALPASVAPGEIGLFTFPIRSPSAAGATPFRYDMGVNGVGFFGATCVDLSIALSAPIIDLADGPSGRTLTGGAASYLAATTIGDFNDDSVPDVLVGKLTPPAGVARNQCGVVYGFVGGAGFFTGTSDALPSDAAFAIVGAEAGDKLGIYHEGNIVLGDLTGDGVEDVIVSSPWADGPSNARDSAGEVYVIEGGLGLSSAGTIDLGAATPSPLVATTIFGAAAADRLTVIGVADITGDGLNDLILGAPQSGVGGTGAGIVYIVAGTATGITGTIDLAAPGAFAVTTISGVPGDALGRIAALGNFMGTSATDLILSAPSRTVNTLRDGAAFGFAGPITSNRTLSSADVTWIGTNSTSALGTSLAIGDVRGTTASDVVIGIPQYRIPGVSQPGGVAVFDGPIAPGVYDLSLGTGPISALVIGDDNGDYFGATTRLGDVDGDGRSDIVVGVRVANGPGDARTRSGEVAVLRGGPTLTGTVDLSVTSPLLLMYGPIAEGLSAGYHNALTAGDVDGDGRVDICFGTHGLGQVDCVRSPF